MTLALEYFPTRDSLLARLDPRWKLAALVLAGGWTAALQTLPALSLALAGALVLAALGRLPVSWYLARLSTVVPFLLLLVLLLPLLVHDAGPTGRLGPATVSWHGLRMALVVSLKAVSLVTLMLVLLATTPLPATLHAAHSLHVPALLVHLALLTYRYIFVLAGELARLRIALRVRGYRNRACLHSYRTIGHVAGTLLVRGHEQAERVSQAMRCRGFAGRFRSLAEFRTTAADLVLFMGVVGGAVGLWVWDWSLR